MTNAGRNIAAGPPPAPVQGMAVGYGGATVHGTYAGIGNVDLGVPRVGAGGVNPVMAPGQDDGQLTGLPAGTSHPNQHAHTATLTCGALTHSDAIATVLCSVAAVLPMQTETLPTVTEAANAV